jgi:hypothetical protein
MESELEELRKEVELLSNKVELLEQGEKKRKVGIYVKLLVKLAVLLFTIYGAFRAYDYLVTEIPKMLQEKINDAIPSVLKP